jgi:plasmid stabilization system protein ParE
MNKRYSVKITESALSDMDAIYDYISGPLGAPIAAAKQYDKIADEILTLSEMPFRYPVPSFPVCEELELHRMLVGNYSIFYKIYSTSVIVIAVLYSASDFEKRLSQRSSI